MLCNVCGVDAPTYTELAEGGPFGRAVKKCSHCSSERVVQQQTRARTAIAEATEVVVVDQPKIPRASATHATAGMTSIVATMRARLVECEAIVASADAVRAEAETLRRMLAVVSN